MLGTACVHIIKPRTPQKGCIIRERSTPNPMFFYCRCFCFLPAQQLWILDDPCAECKMTRIINSLPWKKVPTCPEPAASWFCLMAFYPCLWLNVHILEVLLVLSLKEPCDALCESQCQQKVANLDDGQGVQSSLTICRLNLYFKILGELLVCHMGGQSSFTMCTLNLNLKILGEILVWSVILEGSIIFHHVQADS